MISCASHCVCSHLKETSRESSLSGEKDGPRTGLTKPAGLPLFVSLHYCGMDSNGPWSWAEPSSEKWSQADNSKWINTCVVKVKWCCVVRCYWTCRVTLHDTVASFCLCFFFAPGGGKAEDFISVFITGSNTHNSISSAMQQSRL